MRRAERGFTLAELMVVIALVGAVAGIFGSMASALHRSDMQSRAYVEDLAGLRRAVATIERDLRRTADPAELDVRLEQETLLRAGRPIARNVAGFSLERAGDLVTVRLRLARRRETPAARRPEIITRVWLRNAGSKR